MNMTVVSRVLVFLAVLTVGVLMTGCTSQIFNPNFLSSSGLAPTSPQTQITPNLPEFLVLKVTNQTDYAARVNITIKRSVVDETFNVTVESQQTLGKLVEACDSATDPVLSVFVPLITADNQTDQAIPLGEAFVTVLGLPVAIPASQLPGALNNREHFNCGDTVEFVVHTSFSDVDRYQISALVYAGTATQ